MCREVCAATNDEQLLNLVGKDAPEVSLFDLG
jgi:hypothetical protein